MKKEPFFLQKIPIDIGYTSKKPYNGFLYTYPFIWIKSTFSKGKLEKKALESDFFGKIPIDIGYCSEKALQWLLILFSIHLD